LIITKSFIIYDEMKSTIIKSFSQGRIVVPFLMLSLLLASLILTSYHDHQSDTAADNCLLCNFQTTYSAVTIEPTSDSAVFQKPFLESTVTLNEDVTNPSQKRVCTSHAPPLYS
jgi:hypothetical protein